MAFQSKRFGIGPDKGFLADQRHGQCLPILARGGQFGPDL
jgi:hypothetical protein